jgi:cell division protein FtsB
MGFIQIINRKKITIISFFLFFYIILNLLDGERGLISYYEKQNIKKQLLEEKSFLTEQLNIVEKKNELLTEKIDLDYLEILFREKFMFGKPNEKIYKSN